MLVVPRWPRSDTADHRRRESRIVEVRNGHTVHRLPEREPCRQTRTIRRRCVGSPRISSLKSIRKPASRRQTKRNLLPLLVRQWITYAGQATLFVSGQQINFVLGKTPLGKPRIDAELVQPGWLERLQEDWKIAAEGLPDVLEQLNRGQSAEVVNSEGLPLRLWVNPQQKSRGVEPLVPQPVASQPSRDHRKIAADLLRRELGMSVDAEEFAALTASVAQQWQKYQGHACLFVDEEQMILTLVELPEGNCRVETGYLSVTLDPVLRSLGIADDVIPTVIARLNLDQEFDFQDVNGVPSRLWHNPHSRRICVRPLQPS